MLASRWRHQADGMQDSKRTGCVTCGSDRLSSYCRSRGCPVVSVMWQRLPGSRPGTRWSIHELSRIMIPEILVSPHANLARSRGKVRPPRGLRQIVQSQSDQHLISEQAPWCISTQGMPNRTLPTDHLCHEYFACRERKTARSCVSFEHLARL